MLKITVPPTEFFDEKTQTFVNAPSSPKTIVLEHSLVSLAKWEAKWKKPFMSKDKKTPEELTDYIKSMTITQNVSDDVYLAISVNADLVKQITDYMEDSYTATTIRKQDEAKTGIPKTAVITAEIVYYWMIELGIPLEFQKWHLNRLLTLIRVINLKRSPKKMSKSKTSAYYRSLNDARRKKLGTRG